MRLALLGLLLICFVSCSNEQELPKDVLKEDKMRAVMWDILRADEWVVYEQTKDSALDRTKRSQELYQKVFQVNRITATQFKKSFQYYQSRPDLLKPLFDSLQRKGPRSPIHTL
ncbi:MAG TPA: DUF4296 domain-containing protein [Flavisolibacter sp.]|nr:DUF4296 domain-containing protein [Flavisolibacter sp.]